MACKKAPFHYLCLSLLQNAFLTATEKKSTVRITEVLPGLGPAQLVVDKLQVLDDDELSFFTSSAHPYFPIYPAICFPNRAVMVHVRMMQV